MATYRDQIIRRDIYVERSKQTPYKLRTFADMRKLFKATYWALLVGIVVFPITGIALLTCFPSKIYGYIPFLFVPLLNIIHEFWGYRMCNPSELQKEHDDVNANLEGYIEIIQSTLRKHGITTKAQRDTLKKECEKELSLHNKHYQSANSKIYTMLINVPLTAFVSALMYKNEWENIIISSITIIVAVGLIIIGVSKIIKQITFYSDGHFKDQYLLEALNELDYLPE